MLSAWFSGMHCYTRSSKFVNRKKMKQTVKANRPGNQGFSFTGEFPEAEDWTPVEAMGRRRSYMSPSDVQNARGAVSAQDVGREGICSEHGMRLSVALALLFVFGALLCSVWLSAYSVNAGVSKRLAQQDVRMETLNVEATTIRSEIASRSSGVNVRQEALRIGLKNSRGMDLEYVDVPADAVIDPTSYGLQRDMASVFGR